MGPTRGAHRSASEGGVLEAARGGCWPSWAGAAGLGRSVGPQPGWVGRWRRGEREGERWAEGEGAGPERREGFLSFFLTENLNSFVNQIPNYFQTIFQNKFEPIL